MTVCSAFSTWWNLGRVCVSHFYSTVIDYSLYFILCVYCFLSIHLSIYPELDIKLQWPARKYLGSYSIGHPRYEISCQVACIAHIPLLRAARWQLTGSNSCFDSCLMYTTIRILCQNQNPLIITKRKLFLVAATAPIQSRNITYKKYEMD